MGVIPLLDEEGNAYLTDFGLAKVLAAVSEITQDGALVGSPAYVSPEQIKGEALTSAADIYSLGLVLYETLTGCYPFAGDLTPMQLIYKQLNDSLPSVSDVSPHLSPGLDAVIRRATAKDPAERYADALGLASAFRQAAGLAVTPVIGEAPGEVSEAWVSAAQAARAVRNPYKGLRAFEEADAGDFFGRAALVEQLLARLAETGDYTRFLAVVGPSGSGKSSAVKAGLLPALRQGRLDGSEQWFIAEMLPGAHPLEEVEIALTRVAAKPGLNLFSLLHENERGLLRAARQVLPEGAALLLVIDQFEETFTLVQNPADAAHFMESLYAAVTDPRSPLRVIVTLRADFYDRPLMHPHFSELVRRRTEVVVPLTVEELQQAIAAPAAGAGVSLEPGLVAAVIADANEQPGALPLLQYALTDLFDRRADHTLTLEAYRAIGGTLGALANRADEVFAGLDADQQVATRQLFLRLITLGEGTEDTRRRTLQAELLALGEPETMQPVIDAFGRARLLTFDRDPVTRGPTVEVAHEALLREWGQMRNWLDENRDDVRQQRLLARSAAEWQAADLDTSYLLTGSRLVQFDDWAAQTGMALTATERDYLSASIRERQRQEAAEQSRRVREEFFRRQAQRVLQILLAVFVAGAIISGTLAVVAFDRERQAQVARENSDANAAYAQELALVNGARAALASGDLDTALALAVTANNVEQPSAQAQVILSEVAYAPGTARVFDVGHRQSVITVSLSPDERTAVSASWGSTVAVWDVETGTVLHELLDYEDGWTGGMFSPDGRSILTITGNVEGTQEIGMALWEAATGTQIRRLETNHILNLCLCLGGFSPDGRWFLGSNGGGFSGCEPAGEAELILWDVSTGQVARTIGGFEAGLLGAAFRPDGLAVLTVMNDATLALVDVETGQIFQQFGERQEPGTTGWLNDVLFSPDGRTAINVRSTGTVIVWDMETYREIRRFEAGSNSLFGAADLSADGRILAVASTSDGVSLWDVSTGTLLARVALPTASVDLFADGHAAVVGLAAPLLRLIDFQDGAQNRFPIVHLMPLFPRLDVAPDGTTLLACVEVYNDENDNAFCQVAVLDSGTGAEIRRIGPPAALDGVRFSPDGQQAVIVSNIYDDHLVTVWDITSGEEIGHLEHTALIRDAVFSPSGSAVLLGDLNGLGIVWDISTGQELSLLEGHTLGINGVAFSPDGLMALTGAQDGLMILWNTATGQEIFRFDHGIPVNSVEFSPDGQMAISGSDDGLARLWDLNTGAELRQFVGHTRPVYDVHFSPDGRTVFTSGENEVILQWDIATGQAVRRYPRGSGWRFAVSPDGRSLFVPSTEPDSAIYQYRVDTAQDFLAWTLEHRYVRDLTCAEHEQYRIEPLCE